MFNTRNKSCISAHPCIILYILSVKSFIRLCSISHCSFISMRTASITTPFRNVRHFGYRASFLCIRHRLKAVSQSRKRGSIVKVIDILYGSVYLVQPLLISTQDYTMDSLGCQNTKSNQVMFQTKKQEESEY